MLDVRFEQPLHTHQDWTFGVWRF